MDCYMVLGGKLSGDETPRKKGLQEAGHHAQSYNGGKLRTKITA